MEMKEDAPQQLKFNAKAGAYNMVNNHWSITEHTRPKKQHFSNG
jgi:hypothetical protein